MHRTNSTHVVLRPRQCAKSMICLDGGGKDRKSRLAGDACIVRVYINASDLNFLARSGYVNQVSKQHNVLVAWNTSRGNRTWSLLDSELLVVAIQSQFLIYLERSMFLTAWTQVRADLGGIILSERAQAHITT